MKSSEKSKPKMGLLLLEEQPKVTDVPGLQTARETFDFPVIGEVVQGASGRKLVLEGDLTLTSEFIKAARNLELRGVKAISGQCGFMALFQQEISISVSIPVFTSSLILVPLVHRMLRKDQKVGILTINSKSLSNKHFNAVGWSNKDFPVVVSGVEEIESWKIYQNEKWDFEQMGVDLIELAKHFIQENPSIGAIVLECTLMPPFAHSIREVTGLPVFDITTLTKMVFDGIREN